jgi:serine/threonine-protein kinase
MRDALMDKFLHYDIAGKLGRGKHGDVYQALDSGLSRAVAIKVFEPPILIDPEREQFLDEMHQLMRIDDPTVGRYYGLEDVNGSQYLIREYIEGRTIKQLVSRQPLPFESVLSLCYEIVQSLQRVHNQGVLHLNITSKNVFVTDRGKARLVDFGLPFGEPGFDFSMAEPDDLVYVAPEQLKNEPVDRQTDLYALGVVMYEMLTGKLPFPVKDTADTMRHILEISADLEEREVHNHPHEAHLLLSRLLAKNPSDRFASVNGLLTTLAELAELEREEHRAGRAGPLADRSRQYLLIALVVAALLIFWIVITAVRQ